MDVRSPSLSLPGEPGPEPGFEASSSSSGSLWERQPTHALEEAIGSATAGRLKIVLLKMCKNNAICRHLASKELLIQARGMRRTAPYRLTHKENSKKRVRKAYEIYS